MALYSTERNVNMISDSQQAHKCLPRKDEEIFYSYGAHSDDVLLAEYGFVLGHPTNTNHSFNVTQHVEAFFDGLEADESKRKRKALEDAKYTGCVVSPYTFIYILTVIGTGITILR
jgi:hypothetical protein